jgi:hypothetical protein
LRFCWYFSHDNAEFVTSGILKRDVQVAVRFCSKLNCATRKSIPFFFSGDAL